MEMEHQSQTPLTRIPDSPDDKCRADIPPIWIPALKWFEYAHLPDHLQVISKPFNQLARKICRSIEPGPERTVALRKLLESKDAAVRAVVSPGG